MTAHSSDRGRSTPRGQDIYGVRAHVDGHFKTLYYPSDDNARLVERFAAFRRSVAARCATPMSAAARSLACAVAFDAPCLTELPAIYCALSRPYRVKDHIAVEWRNAHGVTDRRLLSPFTVLALKELGESAWPSFEQASAEVLASAGADTLDALCNASGAWMLTHVPTWLLPRIFGTGRSASLPRSALARWASKLCVVAPEQMPVLKPQDLELIDGCNASAGEDGDDELFSSISNTCVEKDSVRHKEIERMRQGLLGLLPRAVAAGPASCLMLWFALSLVEHGTRGTPLLAAASIGEYVRLTVTVAQRQLRGLQVADLTSERLADFYRAVIAAAKEGQASKAHPACVALHDFLGTWHDVGPWPLSDVKVPQSKPKAQAVFQHERDRIWQALGDQDWTSPARWRVKVIFAIHASSPRRKQDAAVIRVGDLRTHEGRVVMDIDPNPLIDKKLKSETSRVSVEITDPHCAQVLLAAQAHRRKEGAADRDKLLGTRDAPDIAWRFEACHTLFIYLLKWATGEPEVSARSLRHTHLTETLMERDLSQRELDQLSASAGHVSDSTTLDNYGHGFEFAARRAMDASFAQIEVSSAAVALWAGSNPATVRKAWSRGTAPRTIVTKDLLDAAAETVQFKDVTEGLLMGEPGALELPALDRSATRMSVDLVLRILVDLCADDQSFDADQIAARHTCAPSLIEAVEATVQALIGPKHWERPRFDKCTVASTLAGAPMLIDMSRAMQPKSAALLKRLVRLDATARRELATCWLRVARGDGYVCQDLAALLPMLKALREAGTTPAQIMLAHDGSLQNLAAFEARLSALMGGRCTVEHQSPRGGRAHAYIQVTEPGKSGRASRSMAGMNAVLLSLAVNQHIVGGGL